VIATVLVIHAIVFASCSRHSVSHHEVNYGVFAACDQTGTIYIADTDSLRVVDSIPNVGHNLRLALTPDESFLFISGDFTQFGRAIAKYSLSQKGFVASLTVAYYDTPVFVLKGAAFLTGPAELYVCDIANFAHRAVIRDTFRVVDAVRADSLVVARVTYTDTYREINVLTGGLHGKYVPHLKSGPPLALSSTYSAVYNAPARRLALIIQSGPDETNFLYGDMTTGETLIEQPLNFPFGVIAISPDGRLLAVSDPGNYGPGSSSAISVDLFDLQSLERIRRLSHQLYGDDLQVCGRLQFMPDGKQLLTLPGVGVSGGFGGPLQIIDLSNFATLSTQYVPDSLSSVLGVAIAPR
jgi:hypothetical protein